MSKLSRGIERSNTSMTLHLDYLSAKSRARLSTGHAERWAILALLPAAMTTGFRAATYLWRWAEEWMRGWGAQFPFPYTSRWVSVRSLTIEVYDGNLGTIACVDMIAVGLLLVALTARTGFKRQRMSIAYYIIILLLLSVLRRACPTGGA